MIFKTITTDLNGTINKLGIFNRSFADLKNAISVNGIGGLFNSISPTITSKDLSNIKEYNHLVSVEGVSSQTAWYRTMLSSSKAAQSLFDDEKNLIRTNNGLVLSEETVTQATNTMTLGAKAAKVGMQALATAGNMLAMWAVTEVISLATKAIDDYVHAAEIAREKSSELTDKWTEENSLINDSISKYKELREKLDDTSLSASEVKSIKEDLISVQDSLVEKYGQEALGIDLLNGKYDEQIEKLEELSKKKAKEYVAENYSNIQEDKAYVTESVNLGSELQGKTRGFTSKSPEEEFGFDLEKYIAQYNNLNIGKKYYGRDMLSWEYTLVTDGTREEIYSQLTELFDKLSTDFGESNESVNRFKEQLSKILQDSFDTEQMEKSKNNIKKYAEAEILSDDNTRKLYENAINAVDEYNEALSTGKGVDKAKNNLDSVKEKVKSATNDIFGARYVFD